MQHVKWGTEEWLASSMDDDDWSNQVASYANGYGAVTPDQARAVQFIGKIRTIEDVGRVFDVASDCTSIPYGVANTRISTGGSDVIAKWCESDAKRDLFRFDLNVARDDLLMVSLCLRAYRLDHGGLPKTLDELVPAYMPAVPIDPFSGEPLKYHFPGPSYVLYSIGPDGIDDGGRPIDNTALGAGERGYASENSKGDIVAGVPQ